MIFVRIRLNVEDPMCVSDVRAQRPDFLTFSLSSEVGRRTVHVVQIRFRSMLVLAIINLFTDSDRVRRD